MIINDSVYGRSNINEKVIVELIGSQPMQRLKGINQAGFQKEMRGPRFPFYSRYEHSVGVMLLLRRLNADLEEQVAGLIHDVSHTVFSHTIDAAFGDYAKENYQDNMHKSYIRSTIIPEILAKHGFEVDRISNVEGYPMLERPIPALCADRVDYTLRDLNHSQDSESVDYLVSGLTVFDNEIIFKSRRQAKLFGMKYLKCQNLYWAEPGQVAKAYFLGDILRTAARRRIITRADLYKTDFYIIQKIVRSNEEDLKQKLKLLTKKFVLVEANNNPDYVLKAKARYVDPKYLENGKIFVLSHEDSAYRKLISRKSKVTMEGLKVKLRFL
jgi:HD superfamily phosphohydrolase